MPLVTISLTRGKSEECLKPNDKFHLINQYEPGEMVFDRDFRGGPRSDDFIVFTLTEAVDTGEPAKERFYKTLVDLLHKYADVRSEDVFVMINRTPPANFSFAGGVSAPEAVAAERARPGTRKSYTKPELIDALTETFGVNDRRRLVSMLPDEFVFEIPETLPYGGTYRGADGFERFFAMVYDERTYWDAFRTELVLGRVLDAGSHLVVPIKVTATPAGADKPIYVEAVWLFEIVDGNFVSAKDYATPPSDLDLSGS
jgi:phenylpyruvate tautomerase PptA (4-oxalocrotonate tautomerase family)